MDTAEKIEIRLRLIGAKNALRFAGQLAAVKEAVQSIDNALALLSADNPAAPVKPAIKSYTDDELLAEVLFRMKNGGRAFC